MLLLSCSYRFLSLWSQALKQEISCNSVQGDKNQNLSSDRNLDMRMTMRKSSATPNLRCYPCNFKIYICTDFNLWHANYIIIKANISSLLLLCKKFCFKSCKSVLHHIKKNNQCSKMGTLYVTPQAIIVMVHYQTYLSCFKC